MPLNLEIKVGLTSHRGVKKIIERENAEFKGILHQKDIYYKAPGGLLKMRIIKDSHIELIKYNREESGTKSRWSDYHVLNISGEDPQKFFSSVFETEAVVEKKRELWMYDNTRIHLDTVKGLGYFLELETLVLNGRKDAEKRFEHLLKLLGIDKKDQILTSYRSLIMERDPVSGK